MPKVSVIIPVYNTELYIERCARSLMEQTLQEMEFIFIDDCSPDRSIDILRQALEWYPARTEQVRVLRMLQNSGQAAVRARGIREAHGEYVICCDSDDWVDPGLYAAMYEKARTCNADVVECPITDETKSGSHRRATDTLPDSGPEVVRNWYRDCVGMFMWNKLVRRAIYTDHGIAPYEGINMWEDQGTMMRVFCFAKKLALYTGPSAYHYNRCNSGSITYSYGREAIDQMLRCAGLLSAFFATLPDAGEYKRTADTLKYLAKLNLVSDRYDWLKEFHSRFPESNDAVRTISLNAFSTKGKIRFLFVKYHAAWLFVLLFKVRNLLSCIRK